MTGVRPTSCSQLRQLARDYHDGKLSRGDYKLRRHAMINAIVAAGGHQLQSRDATAVTPASAYSMQTGITAHHAARPMLREPDLRSPAQIPETRSPQRQTRSQQPAARQQRRGMLRAFVMALLLVCAAAALGIALSRFVAA